VIGQYPTPVQKLSGLSTRRTELWVKRDDLTSYLYGGNKVRKLEHILELARSRSARRLVTFGAAGSHHVLATTVHARRAGFDVAAILTPQPRTPHALANLRTALSLGLEAFPTRSMIFAPAVLARVLRRGDLVVAPGGSTLAGTMGYVDAGHELAAQIREEAMPPPDAVVVALGSAGTAAGLLAGLVHAAIDTRLVAVRIVNPLLMGKRRALLLAWRAAKRGGLGVRWRSLSAMLVLESGFLGAGYGLSTVAGDAASRAAMTEGIALDPTYTAKAFAAALALVEGGRYRRVLYWHTLSSASLEPMLDDAGPLPAELDRLFIG
jgi:1-aminocyclopropane-1-carboxylate deaminase/D-cysteine desulfhydrase-like pyridoxal-dependent ACC family enzyme